MDVLISSLLAHRESLISDITTKFQISIAGAKEFLRLAIIEWTKTQLKLHVSDTLISGPPELIELLKQEVLHWSADEFDEDDFQVIGYCKNIR